MFILLSFLLATSQETFAGLWTALSFVLGAVLSGSAGYFGMLIATTANVLTCKACTKSLNDGLQVAFKSGAVMGLTVVGLGLLGLSVLLLVFVLSKTGQADNYITSFE